MERFELDNFAGPLDLLLYLVQKEELDIREVSLVEICDQYLEFLKGVEDTDIERAGEFFLMAATLMSVKARSLLPQEEVDLDQELDPEEELLGQLLEYRRIKEASRDLKWRADARRLIHPSRPLVTDAGIPLEEVGLYDLVEAFRKVLAETGLDRDTGVIPSERSLSAYIQDLLDRLRKQREMSFFQVFVGSLSRGDLIGYFLAVLELMKVAVVTARQEKRFGEIKIVARGEVPDRLTWELEPVTSPGSTDMVAEDSAERNPPEVPPEGLPEQAPGGRNPEQVMDRSPQHSRGDSSQIDSKDISEPPV